MASASPAISNPCRPRSIDETGWIDFPLDIQIGAKQAAPGRPAPFTPISQDDYELIVGRDVQELRQFGDIIRRTLYWALGIALVLGLGGGLLTSRNFLRRVDAITDASRAIMGGNLSSRMPVLGTGDELDQLARSLNEMLDQIERLMTGMKEVCSNVAHDLKTPLTRCKARVESALRSNSKTEYRAALDKTIEESDRLLQTFNALLSIARAESGQSREMLQTIDAREIVEDVAELYEPIAEEEGGTLDVKAAAGLNVLADRQLLSQALSNLVDNALKYGVTEENPKPHIEIEGKLEEGNVVILVADRGRGHSGRRPRPGARPFRAPRFKPQQTRQWPGPEPRRRRHETARRGPAARRQRAGPPRQAGASASREPKLVWPHDWGFFRTIEAALACTA